MTDYFNAADFKEKMRAEWQSAAGWRKWHDVIEAEDGGKRHSAKLVELVHISPGDNVLDVAGGYGEPSLTAALAVGPGGRVVCNDISAGMLAFGKERAASAGIENVEFVEGDAEQLEFTPDSFDAILSRAGLMFLPDVAGTLQRLRTFLRPGGRLAATVWGPQPTVQFTALFPIIVDELNLPPAPSGQPGVFALSDQAKLVALVEEAGFRDVKSGTIDIVFTTDSPEQFTAFIRDVAPTINEMVASHPAEVRERVWTRVTEGWKQFQDTDGRVRTHNQANWVSGTR
jgi:ubiquinone/menaquinone biosynthesis C-methylase UbiE